MKYFLIFCIIVFTFCAAVRYVRPVPSERVARHRAIDDQIERWRVYRARLAATECSLNTFLPNP